MSRRPQVLQVITSTGVGGAERALERLVLGLSDRYRFRVLSLKPVGRVGRRLAEAGVPVASVGGSRGAGPRAVVRLVRELGEPRPDLVHAWLFQANFLGRFAARLFAVPNLSSLRTLEKEKRWQNLLDVATHSLVDRYLAVSRAAAEWMVGQGLPAEKIIVIPNGLGPGEREPAPEDPGFRERHGIPDEAFLMACAGRLRWEKNHRLALEALARLKVREPQEGGPASWLYLAGEGPLEHELRRRAEELGVGDRVVFAGVLEDLRPLWRAADLHLLPSLWEGMPNVVLEAAAQGLATVALRRGGTVEVVRDGRTGRLLDGEGPEILASVLDDLRRDRQRCRSLGREARRFVIREFTLERTLSATDRVYGDLLER